MSDKCIQVDRSHKGITVLRLSRPEKCNALSAKMMQELCMELRNTYADPKQRAVVFCGEGKAFCAGLDLEESLKAEEVEPSAHLIATLLQTIRSSPLITIAAVHGTAVAGGAAIAAACDYAIGSPDCQLGFPEVRRGLVAALASTLLLRQITERYMRELLLFGELVSAERALHMGLLNEITELPVPERALTVAHDSLKGSPSAILETKRLLEALASEKLENMMNAAMIIHKQARMHVEAQEGISAFLEHRTPNWSSL